MFQLSASSLQAMLKQVAAHTVGVTLDNYRVAEKS